MGTAKNALLELFIARVKEELDGRPQSVIYRAHGGPKQKTLNDILRSGADPSLTTVSQIAHALGVPAWELLLNKSEVVRYRTPKSDNVLRLPEYPKILTAHREEPEKKSKQGKRKTR